MRASGAVSRMFAVSIAVATNPRARGYVINVASFQNGVGYGKWVHIDGWSDSVIEYIRAAEPTLD